MVAVLVALGLKVVGALLIVALLLIPPAAARPFARTPEAMAVIAAVLGALSAPLGHWRGLVHRRPGRALDRAGVCRAVRGDGGWGGFARLSAKARGGRR